MVRDSGVRLRSKTLPIRCTWRCSLSQRASFGGSPEFLLTGTLRALLWPLSADSLRKRPLACPPNQIPVRWASSGGDASCQKEAYVERGQMTAPAGLRPRCFDSWTPADVGRSYSPADAALYLAIWYTRLSEAPFDDELMRPVGDSFERFLGYVFGLRDGVPKTPHWAARLTGIPSYSIRALARHWDSSSRLDFGTETDMAEVMSQAESFDKESFVSPNARYAGLPRTLIGGTVYDYEADEVVVGALVTIRRQEQWAGASGTEKSAGAQITTDDFGNFLVDGPDRGAYLVSIEKEGYVPQQWGPIKVADDANLRDFPMFSDFKNVLWW